MVWRVAVGLLAIAGLSSTAFGAGTTVFEYPASCSVPPSTLINPDPSPTFTTFPASSTPSAGSEPFLLALNINGRRTKRDVEYLTVNGTLTADPELGIQYQIVAGELRSNAGFISTTGLERAIPFAPIDVLWPVSRTFEVVSGSLEWVYSSFYGGSARFCLTASIEPTVTIVFLQEDLPDGCEAIDLGVVDVDNVIEPTFTTTTTPLTPRSTVSTPSTGLGSGTIDTTAPTSSSSALPSPGPVFGQLATAEPVACFQSDPNDLVIPGPGFLVSSLEQCVDYCAGFSGSFTYQFAGIQFGDQCYCGNEIPQPTPGTCDRPCTGNAEQSCGGNTAMSIFVIVSRTTTPPVTGPVDSTTTTASTVSTGYPAPTTTGSPMCGPNSPFDGTVNNDFLILCDTPLSGADLQVVTATDLVDCISECRSYPPESQRVCVAVEYSMTQSVSNCRLKTAIDPVRRGTTLGVQAAILVNSPNAPDIIFQNPGPSSSTQTTTSAAPPVQQSTSTRTSSTTSSTTRGPLSSGSSVSTTLVSTLPSLVATSSPTSGSSAASQSSSTASSATANPPTVVAPTLSASTTVTPPSNTPSRATSSSSSFASTPSVSLSGSTTISTLPGSSTTATIGSTSSGDSRTPTSGSSFTTSLPVPSTSTIRRSSTSSTILTTVIPSTTTTTRTTSTSTPSASALCPDNNNAILQPNNDGYNYEIQCGTDVRSDAGATIANITAGTFNDCISQCTLYNIALPFQCIGVKYLPPSGGANCLLLRSYSDRTCTSSVNVARLFYGGYAVATGSPCRATTTVSSIVSSSSTTSIPRTSTSSTTTTTTTTTTRTTPPPTIATTATTTRTTTTTTTSRYDPPACTSPPNGTDTYPTECDPNTGGPFCYGYTFDFDDGIEVPFTGNSNFEVECATQFTGGRFGSAGLSLIDLRDCIKYCDYENRQRPNQPPVCVGATFLVGDNVQGESNCFLYSSITCASRGNSSVASARLLYAGYPVINDYDPGFNCPPT